MQRICRGLAPQLHVVRLQQTPPVPSMIFIANLLALASIYLAMSMWAREWRHIHPLAISAQLRLAIQCSDDKLLLTDNVLDPIL